MENYDQTNAEVSNKAEKTDTDSQESRLKRAINQYEFEQHHIQETYGKPFRDRFFAARTAIFADFNDVYGEDVHRLAREGKIVSDNRSEIEIHDQFAPQTLAVEQAMAEFEPNVDEWYQRLSEMPAGDEKTEAVKRFLSVLYVAGVSIQPTTDGNKQTFKTIVLSYMHDLLPDTRNTYPPMQQTNNEWHPDKDMGTAFFGGGFTPEGRDITSVSVPPFEPADEEEKTILDALALALKVDKRTPTAGGTQKDWNETWQRNGQTILKIADSVAAETNNPRFKQIRKELKRPDGARLYLQRESLTRLEEKGLHDPWQMRVTVYGGSGEKIDRASWAVKKLWGTPEGKAFTENYIFEGKGKTEQGDDSEAKLFWKATNALENQRLHMWKVMEGEEEHIQRHEEMLTRYSS